MTSLFKSLTKSLNASSSGKTSPPRDGGSNGGGGGSDRDDDNDEYTTPDHTPPGTPSPSAGTRSVPGGGSVAGGSGRRNFSRYHDEPEVDYDEGPTVLYKAIEDKDWDRAIARSEDEPIEAKTWVSRREVDDSSKIRWRLLPLHATCVFRSPLSLIESLIKAYPDGPQMKDDQGMLPVHLACRNGASKGVVVTLLNAFPESVDVKDRKGRVPLKLVEASQSQNKEAVIVAMKKFKSEYENRTLPKGGMRASSVAPSRAAPGAAPGTPGGTTPGGGGGGETLRPNEVDYEHRTVLFRLVLKKDWDASVARCGSYPDEASTWIVTKGFNGNLRFLPLHKACVLQPPEAVVEALVASHPEGAKSRDQDGWLPVHCACFYGAGEGVVNTLLVAHPRGAQCKDDEGRLPVHYACLKGASDGVVSALLGSFPKGAMSKDDEGRLPIHHACSKGAPEGVVSALLKASPKGAQSKDDQGRLPLHHACRKNAAERIVKTLLAVYPRGAQVKDDQDKLPIHYACQAGASEGVVNALLSTFPESINVKNGFGYTPLAEARAMDNPKMEPIIAALERFKLEQEQIKAASESVGGGLGGANHHDPSRSSGTGGADGAVNARISQLAQRVIALEHVLNDVGKVGQEMKASLKKGKDPREAMEKFADRLASVRVGSSTTTGGGGVGGGGGGASSTTEGGGGTGGAEQTC